MSRRCGAGRRPPGALRRRPRAAPTLPLVASLVASLALLDASVPSAALQAQTPSIRSQVAWVAGHVAGVGIGVETRIPIGTPPPLPSPGRAGRGPVEAPTRRWNLTGMFTVGVNGAPPARNGEDSGPEALVHGQAGVLYRTGASGPNAVGGGVAVYLPAGAVGPVLVLEAADLVMVQGGAVWSARGWMGHAGLSASVRFLNDIF